MEGTVTLHILNLQPKLREEFFAGIKVPDSFSVKEHTTFPRLLKELKAGKGESAKVLLILPKRKFDPRRTRQIRLVQMDAPIYVVTNECGERDCLTFLTLGVSGVFAPPFAKPDIQEVLNGRRPGEIPFPRSPELSREGQVRLDFLLPSKLSRILGVNRLVSLLMSEFGFPPEDSIVNVPLIIDEALSNAIQHGNKGNEDLKVHMRIYLSAHRLVIQIEDEGEGFNPESARDPKQGENIYKENGRGIYLMKEIMDRVEWKKDGRVLEMEKGNRFSPPESPNGACGNNGADGL